MLQHLIINNRQKITALLIILIGLTWALPTFAQLPWHPIVPCNTPDNPEPCQLCHLWWLATNSINFLVFEIATPGAVLLFLAAGIVYITSAGTPDKIELAKKILINTVIGLFIVYSSWLVVNTVIYTVTGGELTTAFEWNKLPENCKGVGP